jgi:1-deoxy-D-xylulose-5-phosphate reductoisomerase
MKEIAVLGSTGSIGTQTLDVIRLHPDLFHAHVLAARSHIERLLKQAEEFHPNVIVITDPQKAEEFRKMYHGKAEILSGPDALVEAAGLPGVDLVLVAVVGTAGLRPTLAAIEAGKELALANKETLVAGGKLVTEAADRKKVLIRPVDSEHSAIFQCMLGQDVRHIHRLILTASGGPFYGKPREELANVTLLDAMKHPTWHMGQKVTIDSATMFNKGLEVIEAHWLFRVPYDQIDVVVQPQSIIHSMVEYDDGSIMAQLGNPDMRLPIQFALTFPNRLPTPSHQFMDWRKIAAIRVGQPDTSVFRSLRLAYEAGKAGGDMTTVFNAANEEAVKAFIAGQIGFLSIFDVTEEVLNRWITGPVNSVMDVMAADRGARLRAREIIKKKQN